MFVYKLDYLMLRFYVWFNANLTSVLYWRNKWFLVALKSQIDAGFTSAAVKMLLFSSNQSRVSMDNVSINSSFSIHSSLIKFKFRRRSSSDALRGEAHGMYLSDPNWCWPQVMHSTDTLGMYPAS